MAEESHGKQELISGYAAGTLECPKYSNRQQIIKFAYEHRIPIAEASKLLSNPEPTRPPQLPKKHPASNPGKEIDDLRKEVAKLRTQIEAITVLQPQTTTRLKTLESTVQDMQQEIAPLVELPQAIEKIEKDMATGFESNNEQLATITALLQAARPLAKPPYKPTTNTIEKAQK
ncbi:hypothetical protein OUZ56_008979 [Daphnia magna]|uniref:Terminase small subunit n=1 Tax=Daphnia magna TaxID=35525 RepID=A0ABR0AF13_9CRUS|nr:hypothetical protein OUZ56_008979 [Daphnia magna]